MRNIKNIKMKTILMLTLFILATDIVSSQQAHGATLRVDPDNTGCTTADSGPFQTIQSALEAAQNGDIIFVCPNYDPNNPTPNAPEVYQGPIIITTPNLTIVGVSDDRASSSRILIGNHQDTPPTGGADSESRGIVTLDAPGINFGNFTVNGEYFGTNTGTGVFNGIVVTDDAPGSTVFNTVVENITNASSSSIDNGNGILVEGGSVNSSVSILNNTVSNFGANGIVVGDVFSNGTSGQAKALVRGNYINGPTNASTENLPKYQRGIVFKDTGGKTTGDIFNNRVASLPLRNCNAVGTFNCSIGIFLEGVNSEVTVRYNVLIRNTTGIYVSNTSNITFNNNQIFGLSNGSSDGIIISGGFSEGRSSNNIIQENTIIDNTLGVYIVRGQSFSNGNIIRRNTFQNIFIGIQDSGTGTEIGSGTTANAYIQVDVISRKF